MGNRVSANIVDERYTKPQGLYQHKEIDEKKLRKLILSLKLAPCCPGQEDQLFLDLEECPICFLFYPSLNRSRCCTKGICTECFLQMKPLNSTRQAPCPFCKTPNYSVEYRGVKTKEEKRIEQIEEQKVIEAQIRMQQQQIIDEREKIEKRQSGSSSSGITTPTEAEYHDFCAPCMTTQSNEEFLSSHSSSLSLASTRPSLSSRHTREDNFDLDLEEVMLVEAIWLSVQDQELSLSGQNYVNAPTLSETMELPSSSSHPATGFASAVASLTEHQQKLLEPYFPSTLIESNHSSPIRGVILTETTDVAPAGQHRQIPESFEEQMMLAMAVSLAEARTRARVSGVPL